MATRKKPPSLHEQVLEHMRLTHLLEDEVVKLRRLMKAGKLAEARRLVTKLDRVKAALLELEG